MKSGEKLILYASACLACVLFSGACDHAVVHFEAGEEKPAFSGAYLGQEPPGMAARLFAPGLVSTFLDEFNAAFSPGGKELIFTLNFGRERHALVMTREENGRWIEPEVAPFSGDHKDFDPFVSPEGSRIYFCSNRPRTEGEEQRADADIWYVDRLESGWSDPVNLGAPVNSDADEFYPCLTRSGALYFYSSRDGGPGEGDIYVARPADGKYTEVELVPAPISTPGFELDCYVAPDESYLVLTTVRDVNHGSADLYVSFRGEDGSWGAPINLGDKVNSPTFENCPILSPCGKYFFFTSRKMSPALTAQGVTYAAIKSATLQPGNGGGDIYWFDASLIARLKGAGE